MKKIGKLKGQNKKNTTKKERGRLCNIKFTGAIKM